MTGSARAVAIAVLVRIDTAGAYANPALSEALGRCGLSKRDRAFVTELVYGATRRRRALDWVLDPFLVRDPPPPARAALRIGAYQLIELHMAPYAAVSATVQAAPGRYRGLVNAVLRRVAEIGPEPGAALSWPDDPTRLSYPDWIVEVLRTDLAPDDALGALEAMNEPVPVGRRDDGYGQDLSSRLVVEAVSVAAGDLVYDMCAAPGGKATALAGRGAIVMAGEVHRSRARSMARNRDGLRVGSMPILVADGRIPPFGPGRFDTVVVDAPCSGLGALRRRPDARWRIEPAAVIRLAALQCELIDMAAGLLKPGGQLVYSVCTLTAAETLGVADHASGRGDLEPATVRVPPWREHGSGGILLPGASHDGMALFRWHKS